MQSDTPAGKDGMRAMLKREGANGFFPFLNNLMKM